MISLYFLFFVLISPTFSQQWFALDSEEFYIGNMETSHMEAENSCNLKNARLAIIRNKTVQNFLENSIIKSQGNKIQPPYGYWIGLKRNTRLTKEFFWVDGSPTTYKYWNSNEPSNNTEIMMEDCVIMGHTCCALRKHYWHNVDCNGNINPGYICQRKISKDSHQSTKKPELSTKFQVIATSTRDSNAITTTATSRNKLPTTKISGSVSTLAVSSSFTSAASNSSLFAGTLDGNLTTLHYYIIPAAISLILFILLIILLVMYKRKGRPRTRSIGKVKIRAQSSIYHTTTLSNEGKDPAGVDKFDDDDDDDDDDDVYTKENVYQSTASLENPREIPTQYMINMPDVTDHARPYESVSSMELVEDNDTPKRRHHYTKIKKVKKPSMRISIEIADDDSCYTTITDPPEINVSQITMSSDTDENPYVSMPEMEAMSDSTYSLRMSREIDVPAGEVYDELDQSR